MKIKTLLTTTLLASAGVTFVGSSAHAQTGLNYAADDLLMGFRATSGTGATQDYLLDLGQASIYTSATSPFVLNTQLAGHGGINLGNIGLDLNGLFSSGWNARSDVFWGIAGATGAISPVGSDPIKTLYASVPENPFGTLASPWDRASASAQGAVSSKLQSEGAIYAMTGATQNMSTQNRPVGLIQNDSTASSYAFYESGTQSYSYINNPTIELNYGGGASGAALDLIQLQPGGGPGFDVGHFTIDNGGNITFTPTPEPTSVALLSFGAIFLGMSRLRRRTVTA